jgi:hypothetical protein
LCERCATALRPAAPWPPELPHEDRLPPPGLLLERPVLDDRQQKNLGLNYAFLASCLAAIVILFLLTEVKMFAIFYGIALAYCVLLLGSADHDEMR